METFPHEGTITFSSKIRFLLQTICGRRFKSRCPSMRFFHFHSPLDRFGSQRQKNPKFLTLPHSPNSPTPHSPLPDSHLLNHFPQFTMSLPQYGVRKSRRVAPITTTAENHGAEYASASRPSLGHSEHHGCVSQHRMTWTLRLLASLSNEPSMRDAARRASRICV